MTDRDVAKAHSVPAAVWLVGGMACYGSATPVSAIVGRGFPVWLASAGRLMVASLVLVPLVLVYMARRSPAERPSVTDVSRRDRLLLVGIAIVGTFGFSILMLLGMRHAPGAAAAVVMATTPAVTALGAVAFLGDRLCVWRGVAIGLAVAGVVIVNLGHQGGEGSGDRIVLGSALVFGAVLCEAAYSLMGKRLTADLDPLVIVAVASTLAAVSFLPLAVWDAIRFDWGEPSGGQWLAMLWWGVGTMALGSWAWFKGMSQVRAGTAAPFMAVMPLSALVLSYVLLGEDFQLIHLVGMAIVLVALAAVVKSGADVH